jgi:hypothetical protein
MRQMIGVGVLALMVMSGCGDTTGPENRSVLGRWISSDVSGSTFEMTLSETARSVDGAGRWISADTAFAFGVSGAGVGESVSLLFDLDGAPDINFLGEFSDDDTIEGTLAGGEFRARAITFTRVEDDDD